MSDEDLIEIAKTSFRVATKAYLDAVAFVSKEKDYVSKAKDYVSKAKDRLAVWINQHPDHVGNEEGYLTRCTGVKHNEDFLKDRVKALKNSEAAVKAREAAVKASKDFLEYLQTAAQLSATMTETIQEKMDRLKRSLTETKTIVLSTVSTEAKNVLMDMLYLTQQVVSWEKPDLKDVKGFTSLDSDKDGTPNIKKYMDYLSEMLQIPVNVVETNNNSNESENDQVYSLVDAQKDKVLLETTILNCNIIGTTDVVIVKKEHTGTASIKYNIEVLFSIKDPNNLYSTSRAVCEHLAASSLNADHPVVSVLTDLDKHWYFFWLAENKGVASLSVINLNKAAHAKYLLDHLCDAPVGNALSLPDTLSGRVAFGGVLNRSNKMSIGKFEDSIQDGVSSDGGGKPSSSGRSQKRSRNGESRKNDVEAHEIDRGGAGGDHNDDDDDDGTHYMSTADGLIQFAPYFDSDVANELDLLDFVDVNEQYEIIRTFAAKHIVPYMIREPAKEE